MKIGVWLNADYQPQAGGGFSYFDRLVHAIDVYEFDSSLDICFVTKSKESFSFKREVVRLQAEVKPTLKERIMRRLPLVGWHYSDLTSKRINYEQINIYHKQLKESGIRILFYPTAGVGMPNFPFIATNWDIGHLSTYAFPEVAMDGQFQRRNLHFTTQLPQALMTFCESEAGKKELLKFTNIKEDKLRVVPIFAGACVDIKVSEDQQDMILSKYNLQRNKYFFYPAQFWAHKNHYTLLNAFKKFVESNPDYRLVLTGSDQGNKSYVESLIIDYGLVDKVIFPGFVSIEAINTFYKNAAALVMATYFGPTNMPPLEAMALGCPVVCTNLDGHREQLEDAAIYFDARSVEELIASLNQVIDENEIWRQKIKQQQEKTCFTLKEAINRINRYFLEVLVIRSTWA